MGKPTPEAFEDLIENLPLPVCDYVVIADGSGTSAGCPCGYYAAVYNRVHGTVDELWGGGTTGTNNSAELAGFPLALWHIEKQTGTWAKKLRIACVSDSEVTVFGATGKYARNKNKHLWASLEYFLGLPWLDISWHHIPRNSHEIHERADEESKRMRKLFEDHGEGL